MKNRIIVFINWIYNYLTYDQSLRLIFREFYRPLQKSDEVKQQVVAPGTAVGNVAPASVAPPLKQSEDLKQVAAVNR